LHGVVAAPPRPVTRVFAALVRGGHRVASLGMATAFLALVPAARAGGRGLLREDMSL